MDSLRYCNSDAMARCILCHYDELTFEPLTCFNNRLQPSSYHFPLFLNPPVIFIRRNLWRLVLCISTALFLPSSAYAIATCTHWNPTRRSSILVRTRTAFEPPRRIFRKSFCHEFGFQEDQWGAGGSWEAANGNFNPPHYNGVLGVESPWANQHAPVTGKRTRGLNKAKR